MTNYLDYSERRATIRRKYRKQARGKPLKALWGKADGTIADTNLPGNVWVQIYSDIGTLDNRSVRSPSKMLATYPGCPVILEYDFKGRLEVDRVDNDAVVSSGTTPIAQQTKALSPSTVQRDFETLNLVPKGGMLVSLKGWNPQINGVFYEVSFPDIDLTSSVPGAGTMCYAVIGVKADLSGAEVYASTARGLADLPLSITDVNEVRASFSANATLAWAVKLIGGQTAITKADIDTDARDLRQLVNTSGESTFSTANVTNPPTASELATAFGAASTVGPGFIGVLDDNNAHANVYVVTSDGTNFWYAALTKAV